MRRLHFPIFPPNIVSRWLLLGGLFWLVAACTYVPFDAPRQQVPTQRAFVPSPDIASIQQGIARSGGQNGFFALVEGNDALGARLSLIAAAESTIDLQYFLMKADYAGGLIARSLIEAADRGVIVRLLLDDVFTTASDGQIALLDSHPRIFVRVFNPLSRNSPQALAYLLDFQRANRRMHNKTFVVDSTVAVVGGRNIADEYYQIGTDSEFADFDLLLAGPAVADITASFETFWNDRFSVPIEALAPAEDRNLSVAQLSLDERALEAANEIYERAVGSAYLADIAAGLIVPRFADAVVVSDTPEKLASPVKGGVRPLAESLMNRIAAATTQVTVLTPYFVPEDWGAKLFSDLAAKGVRVRIVTNSLAANNHAYVHAGYMRHRAGLLAAGVELYEIRADAPSVLGQTDEAASLTMHSKLILIDDDTMFVGSLNFDPRSIKLNSEFGVFVQDRGITTSALADIEQDFSRYAFRLSLATDGSLIWTYDNGTVRETFTDEPGAGFWQKAIANLTRYLPVEGQL